MLHEHGSFKREVRKYAEATRHQNVHVSNIKSGKYTEQEKLVVSTADAGMSKATSGLGK